MKKDGRAVLRAGVVALPVERRGVMNGEESREQCLKIDDSRVKLDLYHFGVSAGTAAHRLVSRLRTLSAHVAWQHRNDAGQLFECGFSTPKATTRQGDFLCDGRFVHACSR